MRMDDKSLINSLLQSGSDRLQLTVFKEARAEIWQIFRLVYVDNQLMPYAVCIRCMKPVAYSKKTTGSLHKHPCAVSVNKFWSKSLKRPRKREPENASTSSSYAGPSGTTNSFGNVDSLNTFNFQPSSTFVQTASEIGSSLSNLQQMMSSGNLKKESSETEPLLDFSGLLSINQALGANDINPQAAFCNGKTIHNAPMSSLSALASVMGTNPITDDKPYPLEISCAKAGRLLDLACRCLIPLDSSNLQVLNQASDIKCKNLQLQTLLESHYEHAREEVQQTLQQTSTNTHYVLDFWYSQNEEYLTIWACYAFSAKRQFRQALRTRQIKHIKNADMLRRLIDGWLAPYYPKESIQSNKARVFLVEGDAPSYLETFWTYSSNSTAVSHEISYLRCARHLLQSILNRVLLSNNSGLNKFMIKCSAAAISRSPSLKDGWLKDLQMVTWQDDANLLEQTLRHMTENWNEVNELLGRSEEEQSQQDDDKSFGKQPTKDELQSLAGFLNTFLLEFQKNNEQDGLFGMQGIKGELLSIVNEELCNHVKPWLKTIGTKLHKELSKCSLEHFLYSVAHCLEVNGRELSSLTHEQRNQVYLWLDHQIKHEKMLTKRAIAKLHQSINEREDPEDLNKKFDQEYDRLLKITKSSEELAMKSPPKKRFRDDSISSTDSQNQDAENGNNQEEDEDSEEQEESEEKRSSEELDEEESPEEYLMYSKELQAYINADLTTCEENVEQFWSNGGSGDIFPELKQIAQQLRLIKSSSNCCSIGFNAAKEFATRRLGLTQCDNLEQILFMHSYFLHGQGNK